MDDELKNLEFLAKSEKVIRVTIDPATSEVVHDIPDYSAEEVLCCVQSLVRVVNSMSHLTGIRALLLKDDNGHIVIPKDVCVALGKQGLEAVTNYFKSKRG